MLHVVTSANRHLYEEQLSEMHRQRNELFVQGQGWRLKVRDGGEYDDGDDHRAIYLIALDGDARCRASIRLRPADDFSYLIDHMPQWVDGDAQALRRDPHLWEMARWINLAGPSIGQEIRIGVVEYLLSQGVSQAISCPDLHRAEYAIRTGWRVRFLGSPRQYPEGGTAIATSQPVSAEELAHLRSRFQREDFFLIEVPGDAPWAHIPLPAIEDAFRAASADAGSAAALHVEADARLRTQVRPG